MRHCVFANPPPSTTHNSAPSLSQGHMTVTAESFSETDCRVAEERKESLVSESQGQLTFIRFCWRERFRGQRSPLRRRTRTTLPLFFSSVKRTFSERHFSRVNETSPWVFLLFFFFYLRLFRSLMLISEQNAKLLRLQQQCRC